MDGYREQINRLMDLAEYLTEKLRETEGYELVVDPVTHFAIKQNLNNKVSARVPQRLFLVFPEKNSQP